MSSICTYVYMYFRFLCTAMPKRHALDQQKRALQPKITFFAKPSPTCNVIETPSSSVISGTTKPSSTSSAIDLPVDQPLSICTSTSSATATSSSLASTAGSHSFGTKGQAQISHCRWQIFPAELVGDLSMASVSQHVEHCNLFCVYLGAHEQGRATSDSVEIGDIADGVRLERLSQGQWCTPEA